MRRNAFLGALKRRLDVINPPEETGWDCWLGDAHKHEHTLYSRDPVQSPQDPAYWTDYYRIGGDHWKQCDFKQYVGTMAAVRDQIRAEDPHWREMTFTLGNMDVDENGDIIGEDVLLHAERSDGEPEDAGRWPEI